MFENYYKNKINEKVEGAKTFCICNENINRNVIVNNEYNFNATIEDTLYNVNKCFSNNDSLRKLTKLDLEIINNKLNFNNDLVNIFLDSIVNLEELINKTLEELLSFEKLMPPFLIGMFSGRKYYTYLTYVSICTTANLIWENYKDRYYSSNDYLSIKEAMASYVTNCNNLNEHIKELSRTEYNFKKVAQLKGTLNDSSKYEWKNNNIDNTSYSNVYDCSLTVVKNSQVNPVKYLCKYFNLEMSERTLEVFESMLNNYLSIEEGKLFHSDKLSEIKGMISNNVPYLIHKYDYKNISKRLKLETVTFNNLKFNSYTFRYVSARGNSGLTNTVTLDIPYIESLIEYMDSTIKYKKSAKYQRSLMTKALRTKIKERDNYTCKQCGISVYDEPHLLLEIDHIIPVSKGGQTSEDNLQCLCWQCNRSKSNKVDEILSIYRG